MEMETRRRMEQPLLAMKNLTISYGEQPVVTGAALQVEKGEILGIVGESGSGKTTLLKAAMGLLPEDGVITGGGICYQGEDIYAMEPERLRRLRGAELGMIFQNTEASLCPVRTIEKQLYESVQAHQNLPKEEIRKRALEQMEKMRLKNGERILKSYPFELSGGMNQRVGILFAMLLQPKLILADEPTSALDVSTQAQVIDEMLRMRETEGTAFLLVTHNIRIVEKMADRIAVMRQGQIIEYGTKDEVINEPKEEYTRQLLASVLRLKRG